MTSAFLPGNARIVSRCGDPHEHDFDTADCHSMAKRSVLPCPRTCCRFCRSKTPSYFRRCFCRSNVGRPNSVAAVEAALTAEEKTLVLVAEHPDAPEPLDAGKLVFGRHARGHQEDEPQRRRDGDSRPGT